MNLHTHRSLPSNDGGFAQTIRVQSDCSSSVGASACTADWREEIVGNASRHTVNAE